MEDNMAKMARGDPCAVWGCNNDRYPEKQVICSHVGVLRFYSLLNHQGKCKWHKLIKRKDFKITNNTKVCSNHFVVNYRSEECPNPTLYMKGYAVEDVNKRPPPMVRDKGCPTRSKKHKLVKTQVFFASYIG